MKSSIIRCVICAGASLVVLIFAQPAYAGNIHAEVRGKPY